MFYSVCSIFYILLQAPNYQLRTSHRSTYGWIVHMFYSLCAMFFALFFPGYRCRRSNCEHNDVQPMVESRLCFMAQAPFFELLRATVYELQLMHKSTQGWIASRFYNIFAVLRHWCKYVCMCRYYNCEYENIQPMVESCPCFIIYAANFVWLSSEYKHWCTNRKYYNIQSTVELQAYFTARASGFCIVAPWL